MTRMFFRTLAVTLGALGALLVLPSAAMADTVEMSLVSPPGGNTAYGVYLSPYTATVDGVLTTIVCDSFTDDTFIGETWQANTSNGSDVAPSLTTQYQQIGYLAQQLPGATDVEQAALSFAIWAIFEQEAVNAWLGVNSSLYAAALDDAIVNASTFDLSRLTIYTPVSDSGMCPSGPCGTPQEFVSVSTPEASASAILAFNLLGLLGVVFFVRRRSVRNAGIAR